MTQQIVTQVKELEDILAELPADKAQEVIDFAHYLHQRYTTYPPRGSAAAILRGLEEIGPLEFEKGELDALLEEIEALRQLDLNLPEDD